MTHTSAASRDPVVEQLLKDHDAPDLLARTVAHTAAIAFASVADYITVARDGTIGPAAGAHRRIRRDTARPRRSGRIA